MTDTTKTTTDLPPSASMAGDNTIYIGCEVRNARQHYGVCLFTIRAYEQDKLGGGFTDCARAICGNYCQANKMKAEEAAAGKALYYKKREIKTTTVQADSASSRSAVDRNSASYQRGWGAISARGKRSSAPPKPKAPAPVLRRQPQSQSPSQPRSELERGMQSVGAMSDVINQAVQHEQSTTQHKASSKTTTSSPSERARALAAKMRRG
jgi:hypothetical protein